MKPRYHYAVPAAAVLASALVGAAVAQEPEVEALITPASELSVGAAGVIGDRRRFGMFSGIDEEGFYPLLDFSLLSRDDATGTWMRLDGRDLGLDSREAGASYERQGDFGVFFDLGQTPRFNPLLITTPVEGLGSSTNVVGAVTRGVDLETERKRGRAGFTKKFGDGFEARASYRREEKTGARQWGIQGPLFIAEPIDFTTDEVEGTIGYADRRLQLQGGYLGSFFKNDNEVLNVPGAAASFQQIALPSDNRLHQVHASGGYNFTPTTRAHFKVSYGQATQDEAFFTAPTFAGNTLTSLDGQVDTTLVHLGFNAQPLPDLTTSAKLRYEDREDNSNSAQFIPATTQTTGFNPLFSRTTTSADVEATYRLPLDFRILGGILWENRERSVPELRQVSFRGETDEISLRTELRRTLLENLGGAIGYVHSERDGSVYLPTGHGTNVIDPIHWADRERDKLRLSLDWTPLAALSTQFLVEGSVDSYDGRLLGPRDGSSAFVSIDATYAVTDEWEVTGWASLEDVRIEQATTTGALAGFSPAQNWEGRLRNFGRAIGLALRGQLTEQIKIGADLQQSWDTSEHEIDGFVQDVPDLTDIRYRQTAVNLLLDYQLVENSGVKFNYGFAHITASDWAWKDWVYNDGTVVVTPARENAHFLGVTYYRRW